MRPRVRAPEGHARAAPATVSGERLSNTCHWCRPASGRPDRGDDPPSHVPGCRRGVRVALDCQTRAQDLPTDQPMRASLVIAVLPPFLLLPWDRPAAVRPADGTTAPPGVRHRRCRRAAGRPSPCRAWRGGPLARRSTMRTLFFNHATAALPCFMQPCQDAAIATQSQLHPVEGLNSCA